ncbi:MAG TPA: glyoxalase/bleomycin resistance/extradiol dioxygenase family protein [Caulobacterales bacterium]|jgi:PhnB protein|nr:glyoxalase/bleomycin resistance/extradiol dioxygenase family protein [Caulobacterales bacterium]
MAETQTQPVLKGVTPYLTVNGAIKAIEFYKAAFGAEELARMPAQDPSKLMHAHLRINGADVLMSDDLIGPPTAPSGVTIHLQVDDADKWWKRALAAGATVKMDLAEQFWGDKYGQVKDPFGHSWSIGAAKK